MILEKEKYPIGKCNISDINTEIINKAIEDIKQFPIKLQLAVKHLDDKQLNTQYRKDGWTIRQVIHHCADSHINSFIRLKLTLTEENPIVKPYFEELWATSIDYVEMPISPSLKILEGIHERWVKILENLKEVDFDKTFIHPEKGDVYSIKQHIILYAWHSNHHLKHITNLIENKNWTIN
jgi:hypothetical protein